MRRFKDLLKMCAKITDLIKTKEFTYSFEVTPSISYEEIEKLGVDPTFFSITWHAKSHGSSSLNIAPIKLASHLRGKGKNVCLHLSCDLLKREFLNHLLQHLQDQGICNLFVILGESYDADASDFKSTKELVEYIRKHSGDYFCIGVAGYPDVPEKLNDLKQKLDSGANFVFTQAFTEFNSLKNFVKDCEKKGIKVPIIPGTLIFEQFKEFESFADMCKIKISNDLMKYKNNQTVTGIEFVKKLVLDIKKSGFGVNHVHFYTMNKLANAEKFIKEILKEK